MLEVKIPRQRKEMEECANLGEEGKASGGFKQLKGLFL